MKKFFKSALFIFLLVLVININVIAANPAVLYTDDEIIYINPGENVKIPVNIKNNAGFMGFKITVKYPSAVFYAPFTTKASVLNQGSYLDSISETTNGAFDLLWTGTSNVVEDGELFFLNFSVFENLKPGDYTIDLVCSQEDTFNENWEDVEFDFSPIVIRVVGDAEVQDSTSNEPTNFITKIIEFLKTIIDALRRLFLVNNIA